MPGDVVAIDALLVEQDVEQTVVERDVGAGPERQVQVGQRCGFAAARVDDDDPQFRIGCACVLDAAKDDRMRDRRVGAGNQQAVGQGDVLVTTRWSIGAERLLVTGHRRRHAQARVGVDVVGADQPLGELVEDVIILGEQLPRDVEGDAVRPMRADDPGKTVGRMIERRVPADALTRQIAVQAQLRMQQAIVRLRRQVQCRALAAQPAEVGGVIGVAAYANDLSGFGFDQQPATDAAVTTGGFDLLVHDDCS
ncbi:MAG: hypothetical protein CAPSK01_001655 [Candidatus Accumulibacter vicinus]|uniref:Uncharacterized protein n=1 Tax=Candidatus Accumulibacter vicinus TaxID=2954382 RepID=A0A084Y256_9PROT|nr:MAG: hypothetical protein CAPSK01_001655 [Candidatus Accumulibacter vicinus]